MTEREKLIELIFHYQVEITAYEASCGRSTRAVSERLADYLLASGVIVPPVSFGDKIYEIISPKDRESYFITATICAVHIADGSRNSCQRKRESYIVAECQGTKYVHKYPFSKFGKTVFSNLEDAERALKEREQK